MSGVPRHLQWRIHNAAFPGVRAAWSSAQEPRNDAIKRICSRPIEQVMTDCDGKSWGNLRLVRCRRCPGCLKIRQQEWGFRAEVEFMRSPRTWWVTLTHRGSQQPSYEDVKLFFKRLRKQGHEFRYVVSEENGENNGRLHWHILIHCDARLARRRLERAWGHGYVHSRLARSAGLGRYLAKYVAKQSRIRASVYYGRERSILSLLPQRLVDKVVAVVAGQGETDAEIAVGDFNPWDGFRPSLLKLREWANERVSGIPPLWAVLPAVARVGCDPPF